jgi:hypothetical protein
MDRAVARTGYRGRVIRLARYLRWSDVVPAARSFDPSRARDIAGRIVTRAAGATPVWHYRLEAEIERALIAEYGAWVAGWNWSASFGGGPVRPWESHNSLLPTGETDPRPSVDRVVAALEDWRAFLLQLDEQFAVIRDATKDQPLARAAEHAAARLLPLAVERTEAQDAWYGTFAAALTWYLDARGIPFGRVGRMVHQIISGRFASWSEPDASTAKATCEELGDAIAAAQSSSTVVGLAEWLTIRGAAFANPTAQRERAHISADGHRRYIDGPERARDPQRARRMAAALDAARAAAVPGTPLDFAELARFQKIVLDVPAAEFREGDAFAKQGRERYALDADTRVRFERCLEEARDRSVPVAVRAARVYLDVCFFHPFADGNARAARIALDHVITAEGLALHAIEPIVVVSHAANDLEGAWSLAYVTELLLGLP